MAEIKKLMPDPRREEIRRMIRSLEDMERQIPEKQQLQQMKPEDEPIFNPRNPNVRRVTRGAKGLARGGGRLVSAARDGLVDTAEGLAAANRAYYGVPAGVVDTAMERLNVPEGNPRQALPLLDQLKMNIQDAIAEGKDIFDVIQEAKREARELDRQNAMKAMGVTQDILRGESAVDPDEPGELGAVGP